MNDLITATQREIIRIEKMITETKSMFPDSKASFVIYELLLTRAREAIATSDTTLLIRLLPELKAA